MELLIKASLVNKVERLIMGGGHSTEVAIEIINLVREEDEKDSNANTRWRYNNKSDMDYARGSRRTKA